jgi:hypothetical protein
MKMMLVGAVVVAAIAPALAQVPVPSLRVGDWTSGAVSLRADWKTFGNGPSHTGYFPDVLLGGSFSAGWAATLGAGQSLQQVAVEGGRVFATPWQYFSQAWLKGVDESSGAVLWTYPFSSCYSINPPTCEGGYVYVQRGDHGSDTHLWSFHGDTGVPYWVSPHAAQWERYLAPTIADGKVWVDGGYYGGMYGFQQSDGQQLFFYSALAQYDQWTPSWFAGRIYSFVEGRLTEHDPATGALQWSTNLGWNWAGWSMNRTSAIANSRAFVVGNPNLYAIDLSTQTTAWSVNGSFNGTPAVANGVVYALADSLVKAYDAWDGSYLGVYVGEQGILDQVLVTDDSLVFATPAKTFVYDRASYQVHQTIPFGGHVSLANGRLYLAGSTGDLRTYVLSGNAAPRANLIAEWEPWRPQAGNHRTSRVTITNTGAYESRRYRVVLALSTDTKYDAGDLVLRRVKQDPLGIGQTLSATVDLAVDPSVLGKFLLLVPDEAGAVPETNENNVVPSDRVL